MRGQKKEEAKEKRFKQLLYIFKNFRLIATKKPFKNMPKEILFECIFFPRAEPKSFFCECQKNVNALSPLLFFFFFTSKLPTGISFLF